MFSSISRAVPNSQVTTEFVATQAISLATTDNIDFQINGTSFGTAASASLGDTVTASVTAPIDFLYHTFFNYTLNGVPQVFAVANKKAFTFHVIDPKKQWYNYFPIEHTLTFQNAAGKSKPLIFGNQSNALQSDLHVVMDDNTSAVYFYDDKQVLLSKVDLPAPPIDYTQLADKDAVVVLCFGGEVYEVKLNSTTNQLPSLRALKNYSEYSGDITYVSRIPGEDLISYIRKIRSKKAVPAGTCIDYDGLFVWAGGNGTVWLLDPNNFYQLVDSYNFDEYAFGISAFPDSSAALVTTQSGKIFTVTSAGVFTEIYQGIALGQPARIGTKIYIPEGETGEILVYNIQTGSFVTSFFILDFSPSYTRAKDGLLYICGNDSEIVLVYNASGQRVKTLTFTDKVTWVSVYKNTVIASHWLKTFKLLLTQDLYRVVPVEFTPKTGPISHVSSNLVTAHMLGELTVSSYTPPKVTLWINGVKSNSQGTAGALLAEGDNFSISNAVRVAGIQKVPCIIGDSAFDFVVNAVAQTYFPRYLDFTIKLPDIDGLYTENFLMPANMKPCLMSIEYGTLLLDNLPYDGTSNVSPSSTITITVDAGLNTSAGAGLAPIFTLGQRQFAVPISLNPALSSPTEVVQGGLQPSTPVQQTSIVTGSATLYDFIIPNYYSINIKKNGISIAGDYYIQFGQGDTLTVDFVSSYKRFDTEVVYVLGSDIFKFIAQNEIPGGINFLSYPPIIDPYVRFDEPTITGAAEENAGGSAFSNFATASNAAPIMQYVTGNLQVSGILGNTIANLSISGGDSYFVIEGILTKDFFANTTQGSNVALARTIQSYFDSNVTITQRYYDIEDDYVEVVVGNWGLINQTMQGVNFYHSGASITQSISSYELEYDNYKLMNFNPVLDNNSIIESSGNRYAFDKNNEMVAGKNIQQVDKNNSSTIPASRNALDINKTQLYTASAIDLETSNGTRYKASKEQLDPANNSLYRASRTEFDKAPAIRIPADKPKFDRSTQSLIPASVTEFVRHPISTVTSSDARLTQYPIGLILASGVEYVKPNIGIVLAGDAEFVQYNSQIVQASGAEHVRVNSQIVQASNAEFVQDNNQFVQASGAKFVQDNVSLTNANPGNLLVKNISFSSVAKGSVEIHNYVSHGTAPPDLFVMGLFSHLTAGPELVEIVPKFHTTAPVEKLYKNFFEIGMVPPLPAEFKYAYSKTPGEPNYYADKTVDLVPPAAYQPTTKYFVDMVPGPMEFADAFAHGQGAGTNHLAGGIAHGQGTDTNHLAGGIAHGQGTNINHLAGGIAHPAPPVKLDVHSIQEKLVWPYGVEFLSDKIPAKISYEYPGSGTVITVKEIPEAGVTIAHFSSRIPPSSDYNRNAYIDTMYFEPRGSPNPYSAFIPTTKATDADKITKYFSTDQNTPNTIFTKAIYDRSYENLIFTKAIYDRSYDVLLFIDGVYEKGADLNTILLRADYQIEPRVNESYLTSHYNRNDVIPLKTLRTFYQVDILPIRTLSTRYDISDRGSKVTTLAMPLAIIDHGSTLLTQQVHIVADREYVWEQEISTDYGAFVTVADALYAARFYNSFRPELIYETNLYTYRVILDTGLVCKVPRGRYPVAWLLHGG